MSKFNAKVVCAAIEAQAENIVHAWGEFDTATAKVADTIRTAMQSIIDAASSAGLKKDQAGVSWLGEQIRESQTFIDAVAEGLLEKKTVTEYAQGAMRAYFHGVPFSGSLKNDKDMGLPWGKANTTAKKTGARPSKGTKANPDADARQAVQTAIAALRAANRTEMAASILDLALETWDGFAETKAE